MAFITPGLAVEAGLRFTELHILDGGGRPQLILELEQASKLRLIEALQATEPVVTIGVKAEEAVETPSEDPEVPVLAPETEVDLDPLPSDAALEEIPVEVDEGPWPSDAQVAEAETRKPIDWADMTKAEIVQTVKELYGQALDIHDLKDKLIHQAVELESAAV